MGGWVGWVSYLPVAGQKGNDAQLTLHHVFGGEFIIVICADRGEIARESFLRCFLGGGGEEKVGGWVEFTHHHVFGG